MGVSDPTSTAWHNLIRVVFAFWNTFSTPCSPVSNISLIQIEEFYIEHDVREKEGTKP